MLTMKPIININGTSVDELVTVRAEARQKVLELIGALGMSRPHMRDYIGHREEFEHDLNIHNERVRWLDELSAFEDVDVDEDLEDDDD